MKNNSLKRKVTALILSMMCMFTVALAEPGTGDDPLISLSYIENQLMPRIEKYLESRLAELNTGGAAESAEREFKVVEASAGNEIICAAGTEIILRMGQAQIIATEKGGIADTTAGYDLSDGTDMPANHMLIVPVSDGRGIKAKTDVILMIKGGYTVK